MSRRTWTAADLRERMPRGFGAHGISVLTSADYLLVARDAHRSLSEWSRWDDATVARFLRLAIERHMKAVERQEASNLRLYGTPANCGRNRAMQNRIRQGNLLVIEQLQRDLANWNGDDEGTE